MDTSTLLVAGLLQIMSWGPSAKAPQTVREPLQLSLPEGWIYIPMEAADTFPGAFHDRVSGLVVRSELVGLRGTMAPWAEIARGQGGVAATERSNGIEWTLVTRREARCNEVSITAHLRPDIGSAWNLQAVVCDATALERLRDLVRSVAAPNLVTVVAPSAAATGVLRSADLKRLSAGMGWEAVAQFGAPLAVNAAPEGGFVLSFIDAREPRHAGTINLMLSRDRSLLRWEEARK